MSRFAHLDLPLRRRLARDLRSLREDWQATTIFVSHDHEEAFRLASRVAVMDAGKIQQFASPDSIRTTPGQSGRWLTLCSNESASAPHRLAGHERRPGGSLVDRDLNHLNGRDGAIPRIRGRLFDLSYHVHSLGHLAEDRVS